MKFALHTRPLVNSRRILILKKHQLSLKFSEHILATARLSNRLRIALVFSTFAVIDWFLLY